MSVLDIILLVLFIFAGFNGYKKGFIGQAAGLAGLLVGIWGAIHFSDYTAKLLAEHLSLTSQYMPLIAFAVTFAALVVAVHFVGVLAENVIKLAFLGMANTILGVIFGVLKTALILSVILLLVGKVSDRIKIIPDNFGENSLFYGPVERLAPSIFPYLNFEEIKSTIEETFTSKSE
jgi:membrane protein required for colicin V production